MDGFFPLVLALAFVVFAVLIAFLKRYKKCPPDSVMVIFGNVGANKNGKLSAKCIHGGAAFVFPVIQDYSFLSLTPVSIEIDLKGALSQQNIRIDVPATFTVGVSTEEGIMENAAERLLGMTIPMIKSVAEDIIFGQTRVVIATMDIEEIISNREKFVVNIKNSVEVELEKIGLRLINVNIKDIIDESGYIKALGQEAAARAINDAKKAVAEKTRDGEVGKAEAEKEQRVRVASANAEAVSGENNAKITIADSNATRRQREAEADKVGLSAEKIQQAKAMEEAYKAERLAEMERAERERATQQANIIVPAEISKQRIEIEAEAVAERLQREARGEASAIFAKLEAQAKGQREMLVRQAEGLKEIVSASEGKANLAALLMITDKLPELVRTQVEAIKGINIDKVTVWDSGSNAQDGTTSTSRFLSGMLKSLPPLNDIFSMAGLKLPEVIDLENSKKPEPEIKPENIQVKQESTQASGKKKSE